MNKKQIIAAIQALAENGLRAPDQREADLSDIEFAAQDAREKLEELYEDR